MDIIASSSVAGVIKRSFDRPGRNWVQHIVFPDFQRPYCWSASDIRKILDDIDELRYFPAEERYREDEYYLGAICLKPVKDSSDPEHTHDLELLDGQQRLTSLMILARILYNRAMSSDKSEIRNLGGNISWIMGRDLVWKKAFLYREPKTIRRIREVHEELDRDYQQLELDTGMNATDEKGLSFYEETLLRDLRRFRYILLRGQFAVTILTSLKEAEQYFQGENNRGLPMSLLDILKAYHMRFETAPKRLEEIRRLWKIFNEVPRHDGEASADGVGNLFSEEQANRKQAVENYVLPALLMRFGIAPWSRSANTPANADLLKGIIGTHRKDRVVDEKLLTRTSDKRLFDLLEPVPTGLGFFRMLEQYRRIDEAIEIAVNEHFNPADELDLSYDQRLILRLALIAWADRFAPRESLDEEKTTNALAEDLASDNEFRSYGRTFARFLNRLRHRSDQDPGAFSRLDKNGLLGLLKFWNVQENFLFFPHRSATPAACLRALRVSIRPDVIGPRFPGPIFAEGYRKAFELESMPKTNDKADQK